MARDAEGLPILLRLQIRSPERNPLPGPGALVGSWLDGLRAKRARGVLRRPQLVVPVETWAGCATALARQFPAGRQPRFTEAVRHDPRGEYWAATRRTPLRPQPGSGLGLR